MIKVFYGKFLFGYYGLVVEHYDFDPQPYSVRLFKHECHSFEDFKKYVYSRDKYLKDNSQLIEWKEIYYDF